MNCCSRSPIVAALTALAFFHVTLFTTAPAWAESSRSIACFVTPKTEKQGQAAAVMSSILRGEMAKLEGVAVKTGSPTGNAQAAVEAKRLADKGFSSLNTKDAKGALSAFQKAYELLSQNPGVGSLRLHARVAKGLGVTYFMTGQTVQGKEFVKRSLHLYSKQSANEYAYSIDIRNIYEHAKREIVDLPAGSIEVRSTPEGAEVYLDGGFKGYTPITLPNVSPGSHLVTVASDGYLRWSADVDVAEGGRAPVQAILTASPNKGEFKAALAATKKSMRKAASFSRRIGKLTGLVGAKEALVVNASVGAKGFELKGYFSDVSGTVKPVKATIAQDADFYKNIRQLLTSTLQAAYAPSERATPLDSPAAETVAAVMKESNELGGEVAIDPDSPLFNVAAKSRGESIMKKWWFWTIIGGVVAGAATTVIILTTSEEEETSGAVGSLRIQLEQF